MSYRERGKCGKKEREMECGAERERDGVWSRKRERESEEQREFFVLSPSSR